VKRQDAGLGPAQAKLDLVRLPAHRLPETDGLATIGWCLAFGVCFRAETEAKIRFHFLREFNGFTI
jgi:hypothetical protein